MYACNLLYICMYVIYCMYVCMYVYMYVYMYVSMYVCMYVYTIMLIYAYIKWLCTYVMHIPYGVFN